MGRPKWRCRSLLVVCSLASRTHQRTLAAESWADELPEIIARPEVVHGQEAVGFQDSPVDFDAVVNTVAFGSCSKPEDPQVTGAAAHFPPTSHFPFPHPTPEPPLRQPCVFSHWCVEPVRPSCRYCGRPLRRDDRTCGCGWVTTCMRTGVPPRGSGGACGARGVPLVQFGSDGTGSRERSGSLDV
jgi:hypothetical protein